MIIKTFRFRLTVYYTVAVVLIISACAFLLYHRYKGELLEKVDADLLGTAKNLMLSEMRPKMLTRNEEIVIKSRDEYFQLINYNEEVIITSLSKNQQWPMNMDLMLTAFDGAPGYETVKFMGGDYRTLYFPVNREVILRVGKPLEDIAEALDGMERLFLFFFPFVLLIASMTSWFLAGWALDPVLKIKNLAEQIRRGRLRGRIDVGPKGKEIDELALIFNDMIDSIQHSVETQKRFVSDVSHEIKSPLTSLRGNIEVALRKKRTSEEYEDILKNNLADIIRLSRITDDLLFLTKADNNILELRIQWFDLSQTLSAVVERLRYKADLAGVTITEDFRQQPEVSGDIFLLEQAFSNLIENAIKYTPREGRVTVRTEERDSSVLVTVSDTGAGIPGEDLPHIFERFYRVDKERSRKAGGTGLGLSITEWIVKVHKGSISVKSVIGKGSDFIVTLPKAAEEL
jgi:heavy metal sensor kinase